MSSNLLTPEENGDDYFERLQDLMGSLMGKGKTLIRKGNVLDLSVFANSAVTEGIPKGKKTKQFLFLLETCDGFFERLNKLIRRRDDISEMEGFNPIPFNEMPECKIEIRECNLLGEYYSDKRHIKYYDQTPDEWEITKFHERFHAIHHLTLDRAGNIWDNFPSTPPFYLELLAQLFSLIYIRNRKPNLIGDFNKLNAHAPLIYQTYKSFQHYDLQRAEDLYWVIRCAGYKMNPRFKGLMKQKRILVPTQSVDDWRRLLAEPQKHWKPGYSAMSIAQVWEKAGGLPEEIAKLFSESGWDQFQGLELAFAIPEYKVSFKGGSRPSQNDVFVLLTSEIGLVAMTIEGKSREDFGPTLKQWRRKVSDKGYRTRLRQVTANTGLNEPIPDETRYQLLHRTASAILEAKRFHARQAVILIQSFVQPDSENHFSDYSKFIGLYGKTATKGKLTFLTEVGDIGLYSAWVYSKPPMDALKSPVL